MSTLISVDGAYLSAEIAGDGPPVVLLHAGVGDSRMYDSVVERLAGRFRFIRYDVRGYGASPAPTAPFSKLRDLVAVLDYLELESAHLVGCSMGGQTSIDCAIAHPGRVSSLVLLAPGLSGYDWPEHPDDPDEVAYEKAAAEGDIEALATVVLNVWGRAEPDPAAETFVRDQARTAARAWQTEHFEELEAPAVDHLGEIFQPTVLAIGDRDHPDIYPAADLIVGGIPGCRRVDLPGVDHYVPVRAPQAVADLIAEHVSAAERVSG